MSGQAEEILFYVGFLITVIVSFTIGQYWEHQHMITAVDCSLCVCKAVAGVP